MTNEDNTVWVAFNGEIYNHSARRKELSRTGHHFRTRCDTEVIAARARSPRTPDASATSVAPNNLQRGTTPG